MATSFPILALPTEIRRIVLRTLLVPRGILGNAIPPDHSRTDQISWKVLLTCKKLYNEGAPLLYAQNVFHLSNSDLCEDPLWRLLNAADDKNLALVQRVAVPIEMGDDMKPWSFFSHILQDFYSPPPGFPSFRPSDLVVTDLMASLTWVESGEFFVDGHDQLRRLWALLDEWPGPKVNGLPVHERQLFDARVSEIEFHIDACNLRDAVLATVKDMQSLHPALSHTYLACEASRSHSPQPCRNMVLIFSSRRRAPYHLSSAFLMLVSPPAPLHGTTA